MAPSVDSSSSNTDAFGYRDNTYRAAGGEEGIRQLVDTFYDLMSSKSEYRRIYDWHPNDEEARDKLARFLCGWMGGPKRYHEKYGGISIPKVHSHLPVTHVERDMWLNCMQEALMQQSYTPELKQYLITQLAVPAEAVRRVSESLRTKHRDE